MTWLEHHRQSEQYASDAEVAIRQGECNRAQDLYAKAAHAEEQALQKLDPAKSRTYGISTVSAVSLYFKANQRRTAEALACRYLASEYLPDFAGDQLRDLLQSIWSEQIRERAGVNFAPGQVLVSVKGGEIVEGGAPLDLIVDKVQTVQSLFYRTTEFLLQLPHRRRGGPSREIQDSCRPWLFQAAPGSYQFAVAVQEKSQIEMFRAEPSPKKIADQFLSILRASIESPEDELPEVVPDADYRSTFLELTRSLTPTGKKFTQLDIRSADETHALTLVPATRTAVSAAIRANKPSLVGQPKTEKTLRGVLRALHLDQDWIEITIGEDHLKIKQVGEAVDDVIGPMVNRPVVVQVVQAEKTTTFETLKPVSRSAKRTPKNFR